ncbi:MAG: M24 family metallopeptidase [Gemmatimonadaceae bacterium]
MLTPATLPRVQRALAELGLDGWLLYDFRGCNPIAQGILGLEGLQTRRVFGFVPREGVPVAIAHKIEPGPWQRWPNEWHKQEYSGWRELEALVGPLVRGKRLAMEYSPGDAVPVIDRVPTGVVDMVRSTGATAVSSGELVSQFYATLDAKQIATHVRAAEAIAAIAQSAIRLAGERARGSPPATEYEIYVWIRNAFTRAGLATDHGPDVSIDANAADPHYEPTSKRSAPITLGSTLLIDLFAHEDGGVWADQCWMAAIGPPSDRVAQLWTDVRDARDAAIDFVRAQTRAGAALKGAAVDDIARGVLRQRGLADQFTHRTGHSIDARELHGAGPNLDNLETREERLLIPGVAFSIEPGVYFPGEVGLRSEVNAIVGGGAGGELLITPNEYQRELTIA